MRARSSLRMEIFEGNPIGKKIWDAVWKLPIMQPGIQVVTVQGECKLV